jgi:hypothetical protein
MNLQVQLESAIDSAFRYGHGWPAVFGIVALLLLYALGCVKVCELTEVLWRRWSTRREIRRYERQRDQRVAEILHNVTTVSPAREREVLEAMATLSTQPAARPPV